MQRYKSLVLPVALVAGYFLREFCAMVSVTVPYVIFAILILTFSGVRLSGLRPSKLDLWIALFQIVISFASYWLILAVAHDEIVAQGAMDSIGSNGLLLHMAEHLQQLADIPPEQETPNLMRPPIWHR